MAYEQTNACADGGDFQCSVKGGIFSCRPCDFPQLEVFKGLQTQTNRLLSGFGIQLPADRRDGAAQSVLWVDGRLGPKTATAVSLVAIKAEEKGYRPIPPAVPLMRLPGFIEALKNAATAPSGVAKYAPELLAYFKSVADKIQATTPPSGIPTPEERGQKPEEDEIRARPPRKKKSTWMWWALGGAVLVGAGVFGYYYWYKPNRARALSGHGDGDQDDDPSSYLPGVRDY